MKLLTICSILFYISIGFVALSQDSTKTTLQKLVIDVTFTTNPNSEQKVRPLMNIQNNRLNPINFLAIGLMFFYQNVISEQISANCMYEISCSEYTKRNIQKYGLVKGTLIGLHQLSCCTSYIQSQYCEHRINSNGKIINPVN
ncbi:MAG: membrane protein insertion efficiency factor YidD [Flavobacteriia bacterium]|nr:membrane protein insertion efficiency factor YidD [Flavobacteriia bacterium]